MYKDFKSKQDKTRVLNSLDEVTDIHALNNSIKNILLTRRGSVPGKPEFGSDLYLIIFQQMDEITKRLAIRYTREALARHEDRIVVQNVIVTKDEAFNKLLINVIFKYKDNIGKTQTESTFIPFNI